MTAAATVAHRVHALRTARGWSLDELAGRSGVSKGMLVQVEGARTNPSIGTLVRIADAFGAPVTSLLEPATPAPFRLISEAPTLWTGDRGGTARVLAGVDEPAFVELWEWRLAPHETYASSRHQPGTRELLHVLEGEVVVSVGDVERRAGAGQTVDFTSDTAHGYRNDTDEPARLVLVVIVPKGGWDRRRG
jgi:transcriptional regulator with XRE-family HTH domain